MMWMAMAAVVVALVWWKWDVVKSWFSDMENDYEAPKPKKKS